MLISVSAGILVDWQAPGIGRYTRDWLMRARGPLPVPEDIAIVAIDEASMVRFGRFPWSRQVIARTIDTLAAAHPKVIALDVLFTDPTTQEDDDNLARSIGRAGNRCSGRATHRFPGARRSLALAAAAAGDRTRRRRRRTRQRADRTGRHRATDGRPPGR